MGNKGAFIRFESDMVPHFTSFDAVVRAACCLWGLAPACLPWLVADAHAAAQPHPSVRPMRFAAPMLQYM